MIHETAFERIPFNALDGFRLNFWRYRGPDVSKGPVLVVHGAGVRANLFNPPNPSNLVEMLAAAGYDVWLENWRASIEFNENEWDLDQAALHDHPAAVQKICEVTGYSEIKAIIHCQGSTSFMISVVLGLVPQVKTIITNAVSLHPVEQEFSIIKLTTLVPLVRRMTKYLNPQWGRAAPTLKAKLFQAFVRLFHWEKDTSVGKFVSFTYGTGWPALWELNNLSDETKNWIQNEFGFVPMRFFQQMRQSVKRGVMVPINGTGTYLDQTPKLSARLVLFAGKLNKCFSWKSQLKTYEYLNALQPDTHRLYVLPTYSHLDVFFGKNAHQDVFPTMIRELDN